MTRTEHIAFGILALVGGAIGGLAMRAIEPGAPKLESPSRGNVATSVNGAGAVSKLTELSDRILQITERLERLEGGPASRAGDSAASAVSGTQPSGGATPAIPTGSAPTSGSLLDALVSNVSAGDSAVRVAAKSMRIRHWAAGLDSVVSASARGSAQTFLVSLAGLEAERSRRRRESSLRQRAADPPPSIEQIRLEEQEIEERFVRSVAQATQQFLAELPAEAKARYETLSPRVPVEDAGGRLMTRPWLTVDEWNGR